MISEKVIHPYNLALELDRMFSKTSAGEFTKEEFHNIYDTIATITSFDEQVKCFELFKTLSRTDLIKRTTKVIKLVSLLDRINLNKRTDDISNT